MEALELDWELDIEQFKDYNVRKEIRDITHTIITRGNLYKNLWNNSGFKNCVDKYNLLKDYLLISSNDELVEWANLRSGLVKSTSDNVISLLELAEHKKL